MNKFKNIVIIDDEKLAIEYLEETVNEALVILATKIDFFKKNKIDIITSTNPKDSINLILNNKPIIIFLDIQMPELNGIDVAKNIQNIKNKNNLPFPSIIFTTAYDDYGYKAFQVDAIDYILKPVTVESVTNAIEKFYNLNKDKIIANDEFILIHSSGIDIKINIDEILYFKSDAKYIIIKTEKKEYMISDSIVKLEEKYNTFIKIHRSYLVNPHYIQKFYKKENGTFLLLKNSEVLPVSRRQKQEIQGKINANDLF